MKIKDKKFEKRLNKWAKDEVMSDGDIFRPCGLCGALPERYGISLHIFNPTQYDIEELTSNGKSVTYWGSDASLYDSDDLKVFGFTPLRQTICAFLLVFGPKFYNEF